MATYTYTGKIVTFTAPATGVYDLVAYGAQGGGAGGGLGAEIGGDLTLTAGETLQIAVGGVGAADTFAADAGAGGGGSFVVGPGNAPLVIAGGVAVGMAAPAMVDRPVPPGPSAPGRAVAAAAAATAANPAAKPAPAAAASKAPALVAMATRAAKGFRSSLGAPDPSVLGGRVCWLRRASSAAMRSSCAAIRWSANASLAVSDAISASIATGNKVANPFIAG